MFDNDLNITNEGILEAFPNINDKLLKDTTGVDLIINVTKDINEKTEITKEGTEISITFDFSENGGKTLDSHWNSYFNTKDSFFKESYHFFFPLEYHLFHYNILFL